MGGDTHTINRHINDCLMRFTRRAERADRDKLVATFVSTGPLITILSSPDNQIIYGRRGTGKTHAMHFLSDIIHAQGDITIYIDARTMGSNGSIYNNPDLPLSERATRLICDLLVFVHETLMDIVLDDHALWDLSVVGPDLDALANCISDVRVSGLIEQREREESSTSKIFSAGFDIAVDPMAVKIAASGQGNTGKSNSSEVVRSGAEVNYIHFGSLNRILTNLMSKFEPKRLWILVDEWSTVPLDLQPFMADMMRRALFPIKNITIKIASIEHRTQFQRIDSGNTIGFELGADIQANLNLDDFMVFENDQRRAKEFFKELIFKHYQSVVDPNRGAAVESAENLIALAFTQNTAFEEFVRSIEGVPRDAINILEIAAQRAFDERLSVPHIRKAAHDWYTRDKAPPVQDDPNGRALLDWIIDEVIGHRRARAFLLRSDVRNDLIDKLFDSRLLHILKRSISSHREPGVRYRVYKLDYGCYVDLVNTQRAPDGLLPLDVVEENGAAYVDVPPDDYRSIRRAILDIAAFYTAQIPFPPR